MERRDSSLEVWSALVALKARFNPSPDTKLIDIHNRSKSQQLLPYVLQQYSTSFHIVTHEWLISSEKNYFVIFVYALYIIFYEAMTYSHFVKFLYIWLLKEVINEYCCFSFNKCYTLLLNITGVCWLLIIDTSNVWLTLLG